MPPAEIRLVCFDLGGVIIRLCRSWEEGCRAAGLDVRNPEFRDRTREARRRIITDYQSGRIDTDTFARSVSELLDGLYSPQEILAVHDAWLCGEYPGVGAVVDSIRDAGLRTAALSNTNDAHWRRMDEFPTVQRLHDRLPSHELGLHKPDPAIYRKAEQILAVKPHEVLFFDDLPENVEAAAQCGWHAHRIDPLGDPATQIRQTLESIGTPIGTAADSPS